MYPPGSEPDEDIGNLNNRQRSAKNKTHSHGGEAIDLVEAIGKSNARVCVSGNIFLYLYWGKNNDIRRMVRERTWNKSKNIWIETFDSSKTDDRRIQYKCT